MRQLVYISSIHPQASVDPTAILAISRRNNARACVTGLLFFDGKRFLQALEGDESQVEATFARIMTDERHRAVVVLSDRLIEQREFGDWAMAYNAPADAADAALDRVVALTAGASPSVRATFESFAKVRRAA
ncbi:MULTISPECIES: BLUF domain-containing protein [unclassified Sphingomonas]|uniref:BLUF domain-containing protein n=1 Tax=unclassified Sphingomonas TaxID=196159 RepID=UPI0022699501|nr:MULTISPECIES: BLUF domain-containing protein [unclassified Sphingomonas]